MDGHRRAQDRGPKKIDAAPEGGVEMERETGFEPATATLATWGSTAELLPQKRRPTYRLVPFCQGIPGPAREDNSRIVATPLGSRVGFP
jgi:hypothetical protein